jgi:hypothetical protein
MRRSTVLRLSLSLVFPVGSNKIKVDGSDKIDIGE